MTQSRGIRFRFSLRSLFLAVTLLAIIAAWLGYQAQLVQQRLALRNHLQTGGTSVFSGDIDWTHSPQIRLVRHARFDAEPSRLRQWLGDQRIDLIGFDRRLTDTDRRTIAAFPEAEIYAIP